MRIGLLLLVALASTVRADDFATLCADRASIERVYYQHRLGTKPPFEQCLPRETLERLVRLDLRKETLLRERYGVNLTPALVAAEVQRINTTTRAPKVLAEIKAALGNDLEKFANVFAKPILVERLLRDKFDNDNALHAATRRECERIRNELLAAKTNGASAGQLITQLQGAKSNAVTEIRWQLTPRPAAADMPTTGEVEIKKHFGPNAKILSTPQSEKDLKFYFEDLPSELQKVLRAQLRQPGDVSAVIETPGGFLLYLAEVKTREVLTVATLWLPKCSYEQWLAEQNGGAK